MEQIENCCVCGAEIHISVFEAILGKVVDVKCGHCSATTRIPIRDAQKMLDMDYLEGLVNNFMSEVKKIIDENKDRIDKAAAPLNEAGFVPSMTTVACLLPLDMAMGSEGALQEDGSDPPTDVRYKFNSGKYRVDVH